MLVGPAAEAEAGTDEVTATLLETLLAGGDIDAVMARLLADGDVAMAARLATMLTNPGDPNSGEPDDGL